MKLITDPARKGFARLMEIEELTLEKGARCRLLDNERETAVLLLQGEVNYHWGTEQKTAKRSNVFEDTASCLHVCAGTEVVLTVTEHCELLVQRAVNPRSFEPRFYSPEDCKTEIFGDGVWDNSARRRVVTIFDYDSAPYSAMVMGEVYNAPGCWSSYIPHSHPQPEVYYYRFDKPQGFGACFIGDNAYRITDRSTAEIPGGQTHPQVTAPGYGMYYCWMIAHLENNPWRDRNNDPAHTWLLD